MALSGQVLSFKSMDLKGRYFEVELFIILVNFFPGIKCYLVVSAPYTNYHPVSS